MPTRAAVRSSTQVRRLRQVQVALARGAMGPGPYEKRRPPATALFRTS